MSVIISFPYHSWDWYIFLHENQKKATKWKVNLPYVSCWDAALWRAMLAGHKSCFGWGNLENSSWGLARQVSYLTFKSEVYIYIFTSWIINMSPKFILFVKIQEFWWIYAFQYSHWHNGESIHWLWGSRSQKTLSEKAGNSPISSKTPARRSQCMRRWWIASGAWNSTAAWFHK